MGLVVLAAVFGSALMRAQGFSLLSQAQETLAAGRFPAREVFDGLCVLIGGGLLMWPGFVSDVTGLLLLTPPVRAMMRRLIGAQVQRSGRFVLWTANGGRARPAGGEGARRRRTVLPGPGRRLKANLSRWSSQRPSRHTPAALKTGAWADADCGRRGNGRMQPRLSRPTIRDSPRGVFRNTDWQGER